MVPGLDGSPVAAAPAPSSSAAAEDVLYDLLANGRHVGQGFEVAGDGVLGLGPPAGGGPALRLLLVLVALHLGDVIADLLGAEGGVGDEVLGDLVGGGDGGGGEVARAGGQHQGTHSVGGHQHLGRPERRPAMPDQLHHLGSGHLEAVVDGEVGCVEELDQDASGEVDAVVAQAGLGAALAAALEHPLGAPDKVLHGQLGVVAQARVEGPVERLHHQHPALRSRAHHGVPLGVGRGGGERAGAAHAGPTKAELGQADQDPLLLDGRRAGAHALDHLVAVMVHWNESSLYKSNLFWLWAFLGHTGALC